MMADLRGGFILVVSFGFFLGILMVLGLGSIMRPDRWSDRSKARVDSTTVCS